jgi:hypothetical protein
MGQGLGTSALGNANSIGSPNGVIPIDKTSPTERVTAPGFAQMFENFIKGVDQKRRFQQRKPKILSSEDLIIFMKLWSSLKRQALPSTL